MDFVFDPSLVLYLPLYELDGASFASKDAYGHLCTVTGALWRHQGFSFDGVDDALSCGNHSAFNITAGITLEAWLKASSPAQDGYVIAKFAADGSSCNYSLIYNDNQSITLAATGAITLTSDANSAPVDQWLHVLATWRAADGLGIIYINGVPVKSGINISAWTANAGNLRIACRNPNNVFFKGLIGRARILTRNLSAAEVMCNYVAAKWRYR